MFESINAGILNITKRDYEELEKWKYNQGFYAVVLQIFQTDIYKSLPIELKNKFYSTLGRLRWMNLDSFELKKTLNRFLNIFKNTVLATSNNFYYYLDILFNYPTFPIMYAYLFAEYADEDNQKLLNYTRIEAKLWSLEQNFRYNQFESIINDEKLNELGLLDVVVNGIINTVLPKNELICCICDLLGKDNYGVILKLFQAPSDEYLAVVLRLVRDREVVKSNHLEEMIDIIYATPLDELKELEFKITHVLVHLEMPFEVACQKYFHQAMKILDENTGIHSSTRVRVPVYKERF